MREKHHTSRNTKFQLISLAFITNYVHISILKLFDSLIDLLIVDVIYLYV